MEPIFLKPVLQEKIWGGQKLATEFGMTLPSDHIGEAWSISAHPNGVSTVTSPTMYAGLGLDALYKGYPELFGGQTLPVFPLLVKILDAADDLSIQVHPDDAYSLEHEGELGKTECWYVISAEPGAKIIYGHTAQTKEEFEQRVEHHEWKELFVEVPVKAGDFFYVPSGTIHAIGAGIVILETQQNSDTTYRVYDYDRVDDQGNPRPLHIQQSIDVSTIPHQIPASMETSQSIGDGTVTHYLTNDYFSVWKAELNGQLNFPHEGNHYYLATVIRGEGAIVVDGLEYPLHLADSLILPTGVSSITFKGDLELILSRSEQ